MPRALTAITSSCSNLALTQFWCRRIIERRLGRVLINSALCASGMLRYRSYCRLKQGIASGLKSANERHHRFGLASKRPSTEATLRNLIMPFQRRLHAEALCLLAGRETKSETNLGAENDTPLQVTSIVVLKQCSFLHVLKHNLNQITSIFAASNNVTSDGLRISAKEYGANCQQSLAPVAAVLDEKTFIHCPISVTGVHPSNTNFLNFVPINGSCLREGSKREASLHNIKSRSSRNKTERNRGKN
jgi:hypothetical protein